MKRMALLALLLAWPAVAAGGAESYLHFHASRVVDYSPGPGNDDFENPVWALDEPYGEGLKAGSLDVVRLGVQGSLTLGFADGFVLADGPGVDLIVFENPWVVTSTQMTYAELVRVQVSTDGEHFAEFPTYCGLDAPVGPFNGIDASRVRGFAGVEPVYANADLNDTDPFDPGKAGGDPFDLAALRPDPLVAAGLVRLDRVRFLRLVDVLGDGTETDSNGNAVYDPTGGDIYGVPLSAEIDAISVIHGTVDPGDRIPGDADKDGDVDFFDYVTVKGNFGMASSATWADGDFDDDQDVDFFDYLTAKGNFGVGMAGLAAAPRGAAAPEPAGLWLLVVGGAALLRRRRHGEKW